MIHITLCSFSCFNGVLFRVCVKLVFGFILNTAHLLALKFIKFIVQCSYGIVLNRYRPTAGSLKLC